MLTQTKSPREIAEIICKMRGIKTKWKPLNLLAVDKHKELGRGNGVFLLETEPVRIK